MEKNSVFLSIVVGCKAVVFEYLMVSFAGKRKGMFCPKCSAQNKLEQKFCRNCGQSLSAVRMALEGRIDEAVETLEKDFDKLSSGAVTLLIFAIIALVVSFFTGFNSVTINLILGLLIAGPMIYKGMRRLDRSIKLLNPKQQPPESSQPQAAPAELNQPSFDSAVSAAVPDTDPMLVPPNPTSITEETTQNLKRYNT